MKHFMTWRLEKNSKNISSDVKCGVAAKIEVQRCGNMGQSSFAFKKCAIKGQNVMFIFYYLIYAIFELIVRFG